MNANQLEVVKWWHLSRDYKMGVALLARFCRNKVLINTLLKKTERYGRGKLEYQLPKAVKLNFRKMPELPDLPELPVDIDSSDAKELPKLPELPDVNELLNSLESPDIIELLDTVELPVVNEEKDSVENSVENIAENIVVEIPLPVETKVPIISDKPCLLYTSPSPRD